MVAEVIATACNVGTLGVLIAGAIAAVVQLRHLRASNELAALLAIEHRLADAELQRSFLYIQKELPEALAQPQYRTQLTARGYIDMAVHPEMIACNWLNDMGIIVGGGFVNTNAFFGAYGRIVEYYGEQLRPVVMLLRQSRGTQEYAAVERLAAQARRWNEMHAGGRYPRGTPRMPLADPWRDIDRARPEPGAATA